MKKYGFLATLMLFITMTSCKLNDTSFYQSGTVNLPITSYTMPSTITLPNTGVIQVRTTSPNGCYSKLRFELNKVTDFNYVLKAVAYYESYGTCTNVQQNKDSTINFAPTVKGKYYFKIPKEDLIKLDSIIVN